MRSGAEPGNVMSDRLVMVPPRCPLLHGIHDGPQLVHVWESSLSGIPHEAQPPTWSQDPPELGSRPLFVEPVHGLTHRDAGQAAIGERKQLGHRHHGRRMGGDERLEHRRQGLDRHDLEVSSPERSCQLARPGRHVGNQISGFEAHGLDQPIDRVGRIVRPTALVSRSVGKSLGGNRVDHERSVRTAGGRRRKAHVASRRPVSSSLRSTRMLDLGSHLCHGLDVEPLLQRTQSIGSPDLAERPRSVEAQQPRSMIEVLDQNRHVRR